MPMKDSKSGVSVTYLLQESATFLLLAYILLLGGTFNGLVLFRLHVLNRVLIFALGAVWLIWRTRTRRPFPRTALDAPAFAFLVAFGLATWSSADPRRSLTALGALAVYYLLFYLFIDLLRSGWPRELITKSLLLLSGFILFFGTYEILAFHLGWLAIGGWKTLLPPATMRVRAFLGHPNFVAAYVNLMLPLGLAKLLQTGKRWQRRLLLAWGALLLMLLYFTSSRGGWLAALATLAVFLALYARDQPDAARAGTAWLREHWRRAVLVGLLAVAIGVPAVKRQLHHPTHAANVTQSRSKIWGLAWQMFAAHPLSGQGPNTYSTSFIAAGTVPPAAIMAHAHNLEINVAAETGALGLLSFIVLMAVAAKEIHHVWGRATKGKRVGLAAAISALIGLAVHSQFDTPETFPALTILALLLLAMILSARSYPRYPKLWEGLGRGALLLLWMALVIGGWWSLRAYQPLHQGVLAAQTGDWRAAAADFDRAVERDKRSAHAWFQDGYAHALLAMDGGEAEEWEMALQAYERGLQIEPNYGLNWANYGVLLWASGTEREGIDALQEAAALSPKESAFWLTLGEMEEAWQHFDAAQAAYQLALERSPQWLETSFFEETAFRRRFQVEESDRVGLPYRDPEAEAGWMALRDGEPEIAIRHFEAANSLNAPEVFLGRGLAQREVGDLVEALDALKAAAFAGRGRGWVEVEALLALGSAQRAAGDCGSAVPSYEKAFQLLERTNANGVGLLGITDYAWYVFQREAIASDMLPGLRYPLITSTVVQAAGELIQCYAESGRTDAIAELMSRLEAIEPGSSRRVVPPEDRP